MEIGGGEGVGGGTVRVLLVEDNPDDALIFRKLLSVKQGASYEVTHVERLAEALERIGRGGFDIVVMDPGLPDSRGIDTFLRISSAAPDLPIIVLTGLDDETFGLRALQRGAQDFLVKGRVDQDGIVRTLRYAIERQRMQASLRAAKEEAESADRLKSAFLAAVSHELRTPLNHIIGFTGVLLQELPGPLNPEQRKQLGMVRASSMSLLETVLDILEISELTSGRAVVKKGRFDLREVLERTVAGVREAAAAKGLSVDLERGDGAITMDGDADRLGKALKRLIGNAVKFTDKGGVTLGAAIDHGSVTITVSDTGIGMKPEELERLFSPFHQLDDRLSRRHGGLGLGLALCWQEVELLGGRVEVRSEFGKGSVFTVILPGGTGP